MRPILKFLPTFADATEPKKPLPSSSAIRELLANPVTVLGNTRRWPSTADVRLGELEASMSYAAWLEDRARRAEIGFADAVDWRPENGPPSSPEARAITALAQWERPFPIGSQCPELQDHLAPAAPLMPYSDIRYAALILVATIDNIDVTVYCPVHRHAVHVMIDGTRRAVPTWAFTVDGMSKGCDADSPSVVAFLESAQRWWSGISGKRLRPGRPPSNTDRPITDVLDRLLQYRMVHGSSDVPSRGAFMAWAYPELFVTSRKTTWKRIKDRSGWEWPELVEAVYGRGAKRRRRVIQH